MGSSEWKGRYRRDESKMEAGRGRKAPVGYEGVKTVCVSMTKSEIALIDQWAQKVQMSRSHFLRKASKVFVAMLEGHDPLHGGRLDKIDDDVDDLRTCNRRIAELEARVEQLMRDKEVA